MNNTIQPEELKSAMRTWITGVSIVTGRHKDQIHGMTANSFNSIALNPPTVLVALQRHTRTRTIVKNGGIFGVTILEGSQIQLARRFAGQIETDLPRFEGLDTFTLETGSPLIRNGLAFLDCRVTRSFEVGPTTVFIGEVLAAERAANAGEPLLYFNRQWRNLEAQ